MSRLTPSQVLRPRRTRLGRGILWNRIDDIMAYYVYVLFSDKLRKKYIGYTDNVNARIAEHNHGKVPFTSRGVPWKLVYYEAFKNKKDAIAEEKFLKSGKGRERLKFLLEYTMKELE